MYEIYERLLKERGVKTSEVCRETGIDSATMSNWKKGNYKPKSDKMQKIADYFGVSLEYLTTGKEADTEKSYYLNEETAKKAQEIYDDPNTRILLDARRDLAPEDLDIVVALVRKLKGD